VTSPATRSEQAVATRARIADIVAMLGDDELAVVLAVVEGLARGRTVYGELDLARDRRDMRVEASEELRDSLVYIAAELVRVRKGASR
jgi:hypothetical protein